MDSIRDLIRISVYLAILTVTLCGCTAANPNASMTPASNWVDSESEKTPAPSVTPPIQENVETGDAYEKAYDIMVKDLIKTCGLSLEDTRGSNSGSGYGGLVSCELIDLDVDGVPELVCIYRDVNADNFHTVSLYRFESGEAKELLKKTVGTESWGDNISAIYFGTLDEQPYLMTADNETGQLENTYIHCLKSGVISTKSLSAEIYSTEIIASDGTSAPTYSYQNCFIDGTPVSIEQYQREVNKYYQGAFHYEDDRMQLEEFIQKLSESAKATGTV